LLLRGGFWYVVGHDHDRDEQRTFRVDRFDGGIDAIEVGSTGTFIRPASFDPRDAFPADPKQIGHGPTDGLLAVVWIGATRADAIEREVGSARVLERHADGSINVEVPASNVDAFRSWLIGLLDHAAVVSPPEIRDQIIDWLTGVVEAAS
jgi:proteasome accessory factor B